VQVVPVEGLVVVVVVVDGAVEAAAAVPAEAVRADRGDVVVDRHPLADARRGVFRRFLADGVACGVGCLVDVRGIRRSR